MGIVSFSLSTRMKLLCVVALVAGVRAEAEADPQLLYSGIYPGVYSHAIHAPVVKSVEVKPAEVKTVPLTYTLPYAGAFPYPYGLVPAMKPAEAEAPAVEAERKKREAEPVAEAAPDAEADPWFAYSGYHPYAYGYHPYAAYHPVVKTIKPVETKVIKAPTYTYSYNHAYHPYTYGYAGYPYAYGAYGYGWPYLTAVKPAEAAEEPAVEAERKKREADPAVLYSTAAVKTPTTLTYAGLPYAGLPYTAGFLPTPYPSPVTYTGYPPTYAAGYPYAAGYLYGK